jgi:hypothetical protein
MGGPVAREKGNVDDAAETPEVPLERPHLGRHAGQAVKEEDPRARRHGCVLAPSATAATAGGRAPSSFCSTNRRTAWKSSNGRNATSFCQQWSERLDRAKTTPARAAQQKSLRPSPTRMRDGRNVAAGNRAHLQTAAPQSLRTRGKRSEKRPPSRSTSSLAHISSTRMPSR